jgi:hypothetical protein
MKIDRSLFGAIAATVLSVSLMFCSQKPDTQAEEVESIDSVYYDTTRVVEADTTFITDSLSQNLESTLSNLINRQQSNASRVATLRVDASGYEFATEGVWSFDSLLNLVHCYQRWSSEGREGNTHYFFRRDNLFAVRDEEGSDNGGYIRLYHVELGGIEQEVTEAGANDSTMRVLDRSYLVQTDQEMKNQFADIVELIKENKPDSRDEETVTITVKRQASEGKESGEEKTEIVADRKLYNKLVNQKK